jgi:hypothetical protein
VQGALIYAVTQRWTLWEIPVAVVVTHFMIDLWKIHQRSNLLFFVIDQLLHFLVLFVLFNLFISEAGWLLTKWQSINNNRNLWLIVTGYFAVTAPIAHLMYFATQRWRISAEAELRGNNSLSDAGKWIGIFERVLVYTFVITGHFEGIGFLIAAKSVLRFNDLKGNEARKETEYVLIGTLMSFTLSIIVGLIIRKGMIGHIGL